MEYSRIFGGRRGFCQSWSHGWTVALYVRGSGCDGSGFEICFEFSRIFGGRSKFCQRWSWTVALYDRGSGCDGSGSGCQSCFEFISSSSFSCATVRDDSDKKGKNLDEFGCHGAEAIVGLHNGCPPLVLA
eukprot:scaffold4420_cov107-Cylindrotheca_fusiformis.AAC.7